MKAAALAFAILLIVRSVQSADASPIFPLLGRWRFVEIKGPNGRFHKFPHFCEYEFRPGGRWMVAIGKPDHPGAVGTGDGWYTFQAPDTCVITENYGDSPGPTRRIQFHREGDLVSLQLFPASDQPSDTPTQFIKMRRVKPKITRHPA